MFLPILFICQTTYSQNAFLADFGNSIYVKNRLRFVAWSVQNFISYSCVTSHDGVVILKQVFVKSRAIFFSLKSLHVYLIIYWANERIENNLKNIFIFFCIVILTYSSEIHFLMLILTFHFRHCTACCIYAFFYLQNFKHFSISKINLIKVYMNPYRTIFILRCLHKIEYNWITPFVCAIFGQTSQVALMHV